MKTRGFTIIELLIVITIILILAVMGAGAYSVGRRVAIIDLHAEKLVSLLHSYRDKSKTTAECYGIRFEKNAAPVKVETRYLNIREGCDRTTAPVLTPIDWQSDVLISEITLEGIETDVPLTLYFNPPQGAITSEPSGKIYSFIISYKDRTRLIEVDSISGRIEKINDVPARQTTR